MALGSCGTVDKAIDRAGDRTEELIAHATEEISKLKTETLLEVRETIKDVMPRIIESFLNVDAIAFLIVSVVVLGGLVLVIALWLLLGTTRAWWKRLRLGKCSTTKV